MAFLGKFGRSVGGFFKRASGLDSSLNPDREQRQGAAASAAGRAAPESSFRQGQVALGDMLMKQAQGRGPSIAGEQARQSMQEGIAAQQALAASGRGNQALAARTAASNVGQLGARLAGQAAIGRMQEQQAAQGQLGQHLAQARGLDVNSELQQRALNDQMQLGMLNQDIELARLARQESPEARLLSKGLGAAQSGASMLMMSDRRTKTGIADGEDDAKAFLKGLKAYRYKYKDPKHGEGDQLGVMAQDLEKTRLGKQAVIETPAGKMVHGGKLAGALAAAAASLDRRVSKLEGGE